MAFFNRKKEVVEEVPELERYYAERRTSSIGSWFMALLIMILTVLIILGLFFGGRWAYRELNDDSKGPAPTVNAPQNPPATDEKGSQGTTSLPAGESESTTTPPANTPPTATTPPASSQTNNSASNNQNLPNSGPGEVIAIALASALLAYSTKLYLIFKKQKSLS